MLFLIFLGNIIIIK